MSPLGLGVVFAIPLSIITSVISTSYSGNGFEHGIVLFAQCWGVMLQGKKKKKSLFEKKWLFFWKERRAIPSHQMSLGSDPHNLERSALASQPAPNFSSNIVESHQRWIPRVTHSVTTTRSWMPVVSEHTMRLFEWLVVSGKKWIYM